MGHALVYACLIINMVKQSGVPGKPAYELRTGRIPSLSKIY